MFKNWFKRSTCPHKWGKVISPWRCSQQAGQTLHPTMPRVPPFYWRLAGCLNFLTDSVGPLNFKAGENSWSKNRTYPYFAVRSIEHTFLSLITTQDSNYIPVFLLSWSITATKHLCFYEFLFRKGCSRIFQKGEGGGWSSPPGDRRLYVRLYMVYTAALPRVSAGSVVLSRHEGP